jgi:hypothetical protein
LKGGDFFIAQLQLCLRLLLREGGRGRGKGLSFESSKKGRQTSASPRKWFAFSAVSLASDEVPYRPTQQQIQTERVSERGVGRDEVGLVPFPIAVGTAPPPERQFFRLSPAPVSPNSDQWSGAPRLQTRRGSIDLLAQATRGGLQVAFQLSLETQRETASEWREERQQQATDLCHHRG